jgi:hypothetical protein
MRAQSENWGILHPTIMLLIMIVFGLFESEVLFGIGCFIAMIYMAWQIRD